jgi:hypothetical protein
MYSAKDSLLLLFCVHVSANLYVCVCHMCANTLRVVCCRICTHCRCTRCNAVLHGVFAIDVASHHYIRHTAKLCPNCKYVKPLTRNCSISMVARVVTPVANMRLNLHMHALTMSISHSSASTTTSNIQRSLMCAFRVVML